MDNQQLEIALQYVSENNLRIPLFAPLGTDILLVDEAEFLILNYSDEEKRISWIIANGLNQRLVEKGTFLKENENRNLPPLINNSFSQLYQVTSRKSGKIK